MSDMRILTLDIETSPNLGYFWGLFNQNIMINQIVKPMRMISYAAKWLGEDEHYYYSEKDDDFIESIHELMDESDAIVSYNGINYDIKHLNREFVQAGLFPPTPSANIDLLRTVRQRFKFPSNKLDYVAQQLLGEEKVGHGGFKLWWDCVQEDDPKAWELLEEYNVGDVYLTEKLYLHLRGWIKNHPNHGLYVDDQENPVCRNCGGHHVISKGPEYDTTGVFAYQRYKCMDCGANLRGRSSIKGRQKTSKQVLK